jgi:serine/threonine-protein kinase SRPK3
MVTKEMIVIGIRHRRGSCSTRQKLLEAVDRRCKLVDSGNSPMIFKQDSIDAQRQRLF